MKLPNKNNRIGRKTAKNYQPQKDKSYRFITIAVISFFVGLTLCFILYSRTLITIFQLSKFFIGFMVVGFLIPLKYYQKWFHFIKYETLIFNVIGVGPFLTALFLLTNFIFSSNPSIHQYKIEKIYFEGEDDYKSINIILKNNRFADESKIINIDNLNLQNLKNNSKLKLVLEKGLFGYEVIKKREFVN